jgi:hypothetical protein
MAGFLDNKERVIDMQLTGLGRRLLSEGELRFWYWAAFDDEIDYAGPWPDSSGNIRVGDDLVPLLSMSGDQLQQLNQIYVEETPIREAVNGMRLFNLSGSETTNVQRPLFTIPPGQEILPRMQADIAGGDTIRMQQQEILDQVIKRDAKGRTISSDGPFSRGINRFNSNMIVARLSYVTGSYDARHPLEGFYVRVLVSGGQGIMPSGPIAVSCSMSHQIGYQEQWHSIDEHSKLVYGPDVQVIPYSPGK